MRSRLPDSTETRTLRAPHADNRLRPLATIAAGAQAVGAFALGAMAVGALAVGAIAIGRLAIGRARIRRVEIDELVVRRLHVTDEMKVPSSPCSERDA